MLTSIDNVGHLATEVRILGKFICFSFADLKETSHFCTEKLN